MAAVTDASQRFDHVMAHPTQTVARRYVSAISTALTNLEIGFSYWPEPIASNYWSIIGESDMSIRIGRVKAIIRLVRELMVNVFEAATDHEGNLSIQEIDQVKEIAERIQAKCILALSVYRLRTSSARFYRLNPSETLVSIRSEANCLDLTMQPILPPLLHDALSMPENEILGKISKLKKIQNKFLQISIRTLQVTFNGYSREQHLELAADTFKGLIEIKNLCELSLFKYSLIWVVTQPEKFLRLLIAIKLACVVKQAELLIANTRLLNLPD